MSDTEAEKRGEFAGEIPNRIRISNTKVEFIRRKQRPTKAILMEKEVKDFLDSILAKNTKTYTRALELFEEFMGQTISEIIEQKRKRFKSNDITDRRKLARATG